jgi:hypothetical protein
MRVSDVMGIGRARARPLAHSLKQQHARAKSAVVRAPKKRSNVPELSRRNNPRKRSSRQDFSACELADGMEGG